MGGPYHTGTPTAACKGLRLEQRSKKEGSRGRKGWGGEENQGAAVRNHHIVPQPLAPPIASPKEPMRLSAKYGQKQEDKLAEMRWQVIC